VAFGHLNTGFKGQGVKMQVKQALNDVEMDEYEIKSIHSLSFDQKK
jgi:cobalt/nickel transport system ATP-binding protein